MKDFLDWGGSSSPTKLDLETEVDGKKAGNQKERQGTLARKWQDQKQRQEKSTRKWQDQKKEQGVQLHMEEPEGSYVKELEGLIDMVVGTTNGVKFDMLVHVESIDEESIH